MDSRNNRARQKKAQARRDTAQAYGVMVGFFAFLMVFAVWFMFFRGKDDKNTEPADVPQVVNYNTAQVKLSDVDAKPAEAGNSVSDEVSQTDVTTSEPDTPSELDTPTADGRTPSEGHKLETIDGRTYVDGILIVNKTYSLPADYAPGIDSQAQAAFNRMANDAWGEGVSLFICSGYRTYQQQEEVYNGYARERGTDEADKVSSRPGHSEHQSGLAMDINTTDYWFTDTKEAKWLSAHCADYGFIIRFPLGKEKETGYEYEPWHIRYVGEEIAKDITQKGLCLEEYLGVTSDYRYSEDR